MVRMKNQRFFIQQFESEPQIALIADEKPPARISHRVSSQQAALTWRINMGKIILRLDRVMADRKMSLNELSEKVGVSNVNLSKMKTGKISAIRFSTLEAICEVLDCQPGDILEYDKNAGKISGFID